MFSKLRLNVLPFDEIFFGIYAGRPTLLSGKARAGATTIVLEFLSHVMDIGERAVHFTRQAPADFLLAGKGVGVDFEPAIESGQLVLVPYGAGVSPLPFPEATDELRAMLDRDRTRFVCFDNVLPWLEVPAGELEGRIEAFFSFLDDGILTSLLLLPSPVSPLAARLHDGVESHCPISLRVELSHTGERSLHVAKFMGEPVGQYPTHIPLSSVPGASNVLSTLGRGATPLSLREIHAALAAPQEQPPAYALSPHAIPEPPRAAEPPPRIEISPPAAEPVARAEAAHPHRTAHRHAHHATAISWSSATDPAAPFPPNAPHASSAPRPPAHAARPPAGDNHDGAIRFSAAFE